MEEMSKCTVKANDNIRNDASCANAFDKVIGYGAIKRELLQRCDMLRNKEVYASLGAKMPRGVLLYGDPGLGKTLMAKCFIEESGLMTFTVRRNKGVNDFIGEITDTFQKAKDNAPSIVFLDDMDKFANEDESHCNAEEYVAVQACIDEVKYDEVFVLATVNEMDKLPASLIRPGRFDRVIEVCSPSHDDAAEIIKHYLKDKKVSKDICLEDISRMIEYSSCAELETIMNEAAINAAYARRSCVMMEDIVSAVLRMEYHAPDSHMKTSKEDMQKIALHEAGHLVICEVLCEGSVGLASLRSSGNDEIGGFIRRCKELKRRPYHILVALGGKAATELYYAETAASGCQTDIEKAVENIRSAIEYSGVCGFGAINVETRRSSGMSESLNVRSEAIVQAELERYLLKAKDILLKNKDFLEKTADALMRKEVLLHSDIKAIRDSVKITEVFV